MGEGASAIRWNQDEDAVVVLTLDDPNQAANTWNSTYFAAMRATIERLEAERETISGVILTSAKRSFFAGGDLRDLRAVGPEDVAGFASFVREGKLLLRRLETLGKPVVAAINGAALGGGFEICLAAHRRIIVADPKALTGFPEATFGLLPGAGGVVRAVRMLGVSEALTQLLLEGQRLSPAEAMDLGLVDEIVATREDLLPAAKQWIAANPAAAQPWDREGYVIPGGAPDDPVAAAALAAVPAELRKRLRGAGNRAQRNIMAAAIAGAKVGFDSASEVDGRYFLDLVTGQEAKNMIQAFFFDLNEVSGARGRPAGSEAFAAKKLLVLGAGMMGSAIAFVCAKAGIEVVLQDVSAAAAEAGKRHSEELVAGLCERGRISAEEGDRLLARIKPTASAADAAGADVVIEAVFEDPETKAEVFAAIEPHLPAGALLASNTSTLPITSLAESVSRPADFIGLHFFSPVEKMGLLEIVRGERTSEATTRRALDLAKQIGKTPILVNDSRGFFTSRVFGTFVNEGVSMLAEGVPAPSIEQASSQAGYPAPVLQLSDELNLELFVRVRDASKTAAEAGGGRWVDHPAQAVVERMIAAGRPGRQRGAGFYDYADGRRTGLWKGLRELFPPVADPSRLPLAELGERMLFVEAIEAVRCLEEGVIESVADANVGSILGIGFPGWTGGVLQFADGYQALEGHPPGSGLPVFIARCWELAAKYGERFEPPRLLSKLALRKESLAGGPA